MNLEQAIHDRWTTAPELTALVPAERFITGNPLVEGTDAVQPLVTLSRESNTVRVQTNRGRIEQTLLRLLIWTADYATGSDIRDRVVTTFHNTAWSPTSTFSISRLRRQNDHSVELEDGAWQHVVDLEGLTQTALVTEPTGIEGATPAQGDIIIDEELTGVIDGSNATFSTAYPFVPGQVVVRVNGLAQRPVVDFQTLGNNTILFAESPQPGDTLAADYERA